MNKFISILFLSSLLLSNEEINDNEAHINKTNEENYFVQAARHYQLNTTLLYAVAKTESNFNPSAVNCANNNGSFDYGIMQINSIHLPMLSKFGIGKKRII